MSSTHVCAVSSRLWQQTVICTLPYKIKRLKQNLKLSELEDAVSDISLGRSGDLMYHHIPEQ